MTKTALKSPGNPMMSIAEPAQARAKIRRGEYTGHTAGIAPDYVQGNLCILPKAYATDFAAFRRLAHLPAAMTAHVVFEAIDRDRPASVSPRVTAEVIRRAIGFNGLLMSDDLGMKALSGSIGERAEAVIAAGSDLAMVCSGDLADAEAVAAVVPQLGGASLDRFERARAVFAQQRGFDVAQAEAALELALRTHA